MCAYTVFQNHIVGKYVTWGITLHNRKIAGCQFKPQTSSSSSSRIRKREFSENQTDHGCYFISVKLFGNSREILKSYLKGGQKQICKAALNDSCAVIIPIICKSIIITKSIIKRNATMAVQCEYARIATNCYFGMNEETRRVSRRIH